MKRFFLLVGMSCLMLMALAGCVKMQSHVTINMNGSADVGYILALDSSVLQSMNTGGQKPFDQLRAELEKKGYKVTDYSADNKTGISATKHVKDTRDVANELGSALADGAASAPQAQGNNAFSQIGRAIAIHRSLFVTTYKIDTAVDLSDANGSTSEPGSAVGQQMGSAMANSMLDLSFALTLPVKPRSSNAPKVRDGGKTLEWPLEVGKRNEIKAEIVVPNMLHIGISAVVLALLLALSFVLRRRNAAPPASRKLPLPSQPATATGK